MALNVAEQLIGKHLLSGRMVPGESIAIKIDQTLTQDATGTMAYLQFEALGLSRVATKRSVSYVDHNTLQTGFENPDDHRYLQSVAAKYGVYFSRPGNGICHQVHLERFAVPGETLLGSDSHTPTAGGFCMLAIGAGGLDVAVAMGGGPFHLAMPKIVGVYLEGELPAWCSAKDVILEILRRLTVKGGVGKIFEYTGPGVASLSVPERATITNMGAELGATTSVFPSDEVTRQFMRRQNRESEWTEILPEPEADYNEDVKLHLGSLEPLIAQPHSPDNVVPVRELAGTKVDQVAIGSCTNSSYRDLSTVAAMLKGKKVHPGLTLAVSPGSRQVFEMIARSGALADLIGAGARILESACGPCIGMGYAPPTDGTTVRTFNRNFKGRSGTKSANVYLCSPEVAAAAAIAGEIVDPRELGDPPVVEESESFLIDDSMVLPPAERPEEVEVVRGPNIKPLPPWGSLDDQVLGEVLLKVDDNITTDHILPAGAHILPLRSNIPAIAEHVFAVVDATFATRAKKAHGGIVVGGANYGQGSSREHAAIAPRHLGVRAVLAKGFARIHRQNLINFGIVPLVFASEDDFKMVKQGDTIRLNHVRRALEGGETRVPLVNETTGQKLSVLLDVSPREAEVLLAGGLLNYTRKKTAH
jgi:aconitate hydratase